MTYKSASIYAIEVASYFSKRYPVNLKEIQKIYSLFAISYP